MNMDRQLLQRYRLVIENEDKVNDKIMHATHNKYSYLKLTATERAVATLVWEEKRQISDVANKLSLTVGSVTQIIRRLKSKLTDPDHAIYWRQNLLDRYLFVANEDHLSSLALTDKIKNILLENGYQTITTLSHFTHKELTQIKGIGDKSASQIIDAIDAYKKQV